MEEQPPKILPVNGKVPYRFFKPAKALLENALKHELHCGSISTANVVYTEQGKFYCEFKIKKLDEVKKNEMQKLWMFT
jgi:hypothetical protein